MFKRKSSAKALAPAAAPAADAMSTPGSKPAPAKASAQSSLPQQEPQVSMGGGSSGGAGGGSAAVVAENAKLLSEQKALKSESDLLRKENEALKGQVHLLKFKVLARSRKHARTQTRRAALDLFHQGAIVCTQRARTRTYTSVRTHADMHAAFLHPKLTHLRPYLGCLLFPSLQGGHASGHGDPRQPRLRQA